jgi:hypothetical protein
MARRAFLQSARVVSSRHATHGLAISDVDCGQARSCRRTGLIRATKTALPSSTPVHEGLRNNPSPSIQLAPLDQVPTSPCHLRVPDATFEFPAKGEPATPASSTSVFPLCPLVASSVSFLKITYSPYTFPGGWFSGDSRSSLGAMAAPRWWNARLGGEIWSDSGGHGIAQVYPDLCSGDDLATGSSILPLAQDNFHCAGLVCRNQSCSHQEGRRQSRMQHVGVPGRPTRQFAREQNRTATIRVTTEASGKP